LNRKLEAVIALIGCGDSAAQEQAQNKLVRQNKDGRRIGKSQERFKGPCVRIEKGSIKTENLMATDLENLKAEEERVLAELIKLQIKLKEKMIQVPTQAAAK